MKLLLPIAMLGATAGLTLTLPTSLAQASPDDAVRAKVEAAAEGRGTEVAIPFANHGGIRGWRALDRDTLLIEGTHGRWYRAELTMGCFDLPFADRIGFQSNPGGDFDRFSRVVVRGQRCNVRSLTAAPPPAKSAKSAESAPPTG